VVTVHAYHLPDVLELTAAPPGLADRIRAACEAGNSTFHCTGIHPEFVCNRLAGVLSGLVSEIRAISVSENWDACHISREQLEPLGFGAPPEQAAQMPAAKMFADNYALMNLNTVAASLGVTYARVETDHEHVSAPRDMPTFPNGMTVRAGQVGRLTHRYTGYVEEPGAGFPVTVEVNWMVGRDVMCPAHIETDDYYIVTIEGRPSVRLGLNIQGSFENDEHFVIPGDASSEPGYYATVMTLLHAVPRVCAAEAGWIDMIHPVQHWRSDLRDCATLA
jgi:4-hydroxy-tetrahydrodipicolinate reductase